MNGIDAALLTPLVYLPSVYLTRDQIFQALLDPYIWILQVIWKWEWSGKAVQNHKCQSKYVKCIHTWDLINKVNTK